jgi:hypothetical protein
MGELYKRKYSDMEIICYFFRESTNQELTDIFGTDRIHAIFTSNTEEDIKNKIFDYMRDIYLRAKND